MTPPATPYPSRAALRRGVRWGVAASVAAAAAAGWAVLAAGSGHGGALAPAPAAAGWGAFAALVLMWFAMCVAMMLPSTLPWLLTVAALSGPPSASAPGGAPARTAAFAGGYLAVWAGYSVLAAALSLLVAAALRSGLDSRGAALAGGALLLVAGLFQWTRLKETCLAHCRNPLTYFLSSWRGRRPGALGMGLRHGLYCLGCCWALMLLCLGVVSMSLVWMAALTLIVAAEKLLPHGRWLARAVGVGCVLWGAWLLRAGLGG